MADEKTYYAWSRIQYNDKEGNTKVVQPGKVVTADRINTTPEHWNELIRSGAVRTQKWPEDLDPKNPNALSPNEHLLRKLRLEREALEARIASAGGSEPDAVEEDSNTANEPPPAGQ